MTACPAPPAPLALPQSPVFARALPALGLGGEMRVLNAGGRQVGRALVLSRDLPIRGQLRAILRGPVWAGETTPEDRAEALRALGPMAPHLIEAAAPEPALGPAGYGMVLTAGAVCWLDIAPSPAADCWTASAHPKWRASLNRARGAGLVVHQGRFKGAAADWLLAQEAALRKARRYRSVAASVARALALRAPGALHLLSAGSGAAPDRIIAAMLFAVHDGSATYLMGATSEAGRAQRAHHLLMVEAARLIRREGVRWIDLGQVDTGANPGLARFKLGTGAQLCPLGGSWLRLPSILPRHRTGKAGSPKANPLKP